MPVRREFGGYASPQDGPSGSLEAPTTLLSRIPPWLPFALAGGAAIAPALIGGGAGAASGAGSGAAASLPVTAANPAAILASTAPYATATGTGLGLGGAAAAAAPAAAATAGSGASAAAPAASSSMSWFNPGTQFLMGSAISALGALLGGNDGERQSFAGTSADPIRELTGVLNAIKGMGRTLAGNPQQPGQAQVPNVNPVSRGGMTFG